MRSIEIPSIGITGSSGKTSTILMLKFILHQNGLNTAIMDAWRGPLSFEKMVKTATISGSDALVTEAPIEALRQKYLTGNMFQCGALTNLAVDHLPICGTPERYYELKSSFFRQLPPGAKVVLNADDPRALSLSEEERLDYITFALHYPKAIIVANNICYQNMSAAFNVTINTEFTTFTNRVITPKTTTVRLAMSGEHNISNALMAIALALLCDLDLQSIADALACFPGIRRNMEIISSEQFLVLDDAARNPTAIKATLTATQRLKPQNTIILHGIYGGGGQAINRCNARELVAWLGTNPNAKLIVTRSMYHCKNKYQVRLNEEKAFLHELKNCGIDPAYFPDLPDAIESALSHADSGDLIVFLGGQVLDRAREILLKSTGENHVSLALVPSGLTNAPPHANIQSFVSNPT